MNRMNYGNLFFITLPETILEVVSLLVLIVDLGLLRKSAQATDGAAACWAFLAALAIGVAGRIRSHRIRRARW
jgi:hypothetical protein